MNKNEFLKNLFALYPNTFTEKSCSSWKNAYDLIFGNKKIDYKKLFEVMAINYQSTVVPPAPAWFKEHLNECIIKPDKCAALRRIEKINNEKREPMPEDFKQKLKLLMSKTAVS